MNKRLSMDTTEPHDYIPPEEKLRQSTAYSLTEIFDLCGSDKGTIDNAHRYGDQYSKLLACLPHDLTITEIGVACGASLRAFSIYRPHATIYGYDIREECKNLLKDRNNTSILIQDCTKKSISHPSHLIIDDGSHIAEDIVETFKLSWEKLIPGGFYVIEDLACSYNPLYTEKHNKIFSRSVRNDRRYFLKFLDGLMIACDQQHIHGVETFTYHKELLAIHKSQR